MTILLRDAQGFVCDKKGILLESLRGESAVSWGRRIFYLVPLFLFSWCDLASADGTRWKVQNDGWDWSDIQLGGGLGIQGGGSSYSLMGRYVPEYKFNSKNRPSYFGAGFDLGVTGFNNVGSPNFLVIEYAAYGSYHLGLHWDFRLFAGLQTWTDGQGIAPFFGPKIIYHFDEEPTWFWIDGVFASYDAILHSHFASVIGVGLVFRFCSNWAPPVSPVSPSPVAPVTKEEETKKQEAELTSVIDTKRTDKGLMVSLKGDISFQSGSAKLSEEGEALLGKAADILAKYPGNKIRVEGHCDSSGSEKKNRKLSKDRAETVKNILLQHGVKAELLTAYGFGSEKPISTNETSQGRADNRRVEIYVDSGGK